jgi:thiamine-monophosphate kinase
VREAAITVADLGEFGLIAAIRGVLPPGDGQVVGIGDDAAVISAPDRRVVATTDLLVEGVHFRLDWSSAFDIGCKAAAQNLADVAAMGGRGTALLAGFATPPDVAAAWAEELMRGLAAECARVGAAVVGGDVTRADTIMLAITALGDLAGRDPVRRSGAQPGDVVAVTGTLGASAAGLALLQAGLSGPAAPPAGSAAPSARPAAQGVRSAGRGAGSAGLGEGRPAASAGTPGAALSEPLAALLAAHRRPSPPYPAGPQAADLGATAMIDISDGLVADLGHIAEASGVQVNISAGQLGASGAVPAGPLREAALLLGRAEWLSWALAGGEDHALAATFPASVVLPEPWSPIGMIGLGSGVLVDGQQREDLSGWDHFRG